MAPCSLTPGWYCDENTEGCVHYSITDTSDDGSKNLDQGCYVRFFRE